MVTQNSILLDAIPFQFDQFESREKLLGRLRMYNIFLNTKVYARTNMQQIFTEESRSHIFVKEPEGSSEKILKYVKCTYGRIFVLNQKNYDLRMYHLPYFQSD